MEQARDAAQRQTRPRRRVQSHVRPLLLLDARDLTAAPLCRSFAWWDVTREVAFKDLFEVQLDESVKLGSLRNLISDRLKALKDPIGSLSSTSCLCHNKHPRACT